MPPAPPPGFGLVRLAAPLVPAARRAEWLAEWEGELAWSSREARRRGEPPALVHLRHAWRALGATSDALWLRRRHGAHPMLSLDLKYAARSLRRRPGFVTVVVLTLALGIGATTAVFSVVNGVLLRPLAFPEPERLVRVEGAPLDGDVEKVGAAQSYPDYLDFRAGARTLAGLAAARGWSVTLTADGTEAERLAMSYVTPNFLPTLGVRPLLGRGLVEADAVPGAAPVALLGHGLWRERFAGRADAVGGTVTLDGVAHTVVGVLPPELRLPGDVRLLLPLVPGPLERERGAHRLSLVGRLRPEVALATAEVELRTVARRLAAEHPEDNTNRGVSLVPLREALVGDARPALLVLLGAVGLVLLIACTNLASLFLARAAAREREMAVRAALGAGRGRLVRQTVTESLMLTLAGGLAGLLVAWLGMRALLAFAPRSVPRADEVALDLRVLLFLAAVSIATGLAFGALPLLQRRRGPSLDVLKDGGRGTTAGRGARRLRQGLVVAEVALATVLVTGAALLVEHLWTLQRAPLPFRPDGVLVTHLQLPPTRYDSAEPVLRFFARVREEVAAVPGVTGATLAYEHPIGAGWTSSYAIAGRPAPAPGTEPEARVRPVQPGYFAAIGLPLHRGRDVAATDVMTSPGVVVVNEAFVRRHFAGTDPIGQRLERGGEWWPGQPTTFTIVGVVADEPMLGVGRPAEPATYYAHAQFPMNEMWLVVRTRCASAGDGCDARTIAPLVRARVRALDPSLPVDDLRTLRAMLGAAVAEPRFNAVLLALFAAAALLLAAVGIYGVLSYTVAQRTGEIGVRIALGAARTRVVRQVVGQGLGVALGGVVLGIGGALALGRVLGALVAGLGEGDATLLAAVAGLLTLVALVAAWVPARRASRVEPVVALRAD